MMRKDALVGRPHRIATRRGGLVALSPFASLGATDLALVRAGVFDTGTWPDGHRYDYVKDHHFAHYVLGGLKTVEQLEAFLAAVEAGGRRREGHWPGSNCSKIHVVRSRLETSYWGRDADSMRSAISSARRTHCLCHETGSYADYDRARREKGLWKTHLRSDMKEAA